jgi:DNA polymerase IV (archaeal DinB-like DNA polymerase)
MLKRYNSALAWTEKSQPLVTSDFLYLRLNDNEENVIKK